MEAMAARGVVSFFTTTFAPTNQSFLDRYPGFIYSYSATSEYWASLYSSYVCSKVVPHRVSFSGNALDNNAPRKLGQLYADDPGAPELRYLSDLVAAEVERCGGKISLKRTTPWANTFTATLDEPVTPQQVSASNMAAFKAEGITTIASTPTLKSG